MVMASLLWVDANEIRSNIRVPTAPSVLESSTETNQPAQSGKIPSMDIPVGIKAVLVLAGRGSWSLVLRTGFLLILYIVTSLSMLFLVGAFHKQLGSISKFSLYCLTSHHRLVDSLVECYTFPDWPGSTGWARAGSRVREN